MRIGNRIISKQEPPYIIAELSANHNGSLEHAFKIIKAAKDSGADAVKIQTYTADTMTIPCDNEEFQIKGGLWNGYKLYDLYKWAETPYEWHKPMFDYAKKIGITLFSTPFDHTAVDLLEELNTPVYKIASSEIIDIPLIKRVAQTRKPMIMSTGMANLEEITEAVEIARDNGCMDLALLHCISAYPTPLCEENLATITDLANRFNVIVGLSDHSMGTTAGIVSVAFGACIIEKHFTLNRLDGGPDSAFSLEPKELQALCRETKVAHQTIGTVNYELKTSERQNLRFRRSLYSIKEIKKGELFTRENIRSIRPALGLRPKYYDEIIGKIAKEDIGYGKPLRISMIENWET